MYLLRCATCGEQFEATRSDAVTCSSTCRRRRYDAHHAHRIALDALASVVGEREAARLLAAREAETPV